METAREYYARRGIKVRKYVSRASISIILGIRIWSWDDWQKLSRGVGLLSKHTVVLEDKIGKLAFLMHVHGKEVPDEIKEFCEYYRLSFSIGRLPSTYGYKTTTIIVSRCLTSWVS